MVGKGGNRTRMNTDFLDENSNLRMEIVIGVRYSKEIGLNGFSAYLINLLGGGGCHNIYFWEAYAVNLKMVFNLLNNFSGNPLQDGDRVYGLAA